MAEIKGLNFLFHDAKNITAQKIVLSSQPDAYIELIKNVFTKDECDAFISYTNNIGYKNATINGFKVPNNDNRNCKVCLIDSVDIASHIYSRIESFIPGIFSNYKKLCVSEKLRFLRYDEGNYFNKHYDGSHLSKKSQLSLITLILYLNDGYEGGNTTFIDDDNDNKFPINHETGSILLFEHKLLHEGSLLKNGIKYIMRSDIMYETAINNHHDNNIENSTRNLNKLTLQPSYQDYKNVAAVNKKGPLIYIVYYSLCGQVRQLVENIANGIEEAGCEAKIFQIPAVLNQDSTEEMKSIDQFSHKHPILTANDLSKASAILFGIEDKDNMESIPWKTFWYNAAKSVWEKNLLLGKMAGIFFGNIKSTKKYDHAAAHQYIIADKETMINAIDTLVHYGMIYVPIGYGCPLLANMSEDHGASPYGAGTTSNLQPTRLEFEIAKYQGRYFGNVVSKFK